VSVFTGGCLCGALRYAADGPPRAMGYCFCTDCRRASGGGAVPFLSFAAGALSVTGAVAAHETVLSGGGTARRNRCAVCGALVFGGLPGDPGGNTLYAGSLDDVTLFRPTLAIFTRSRPAWMPLPPGLACFETMPGR